MDLNLSKFIIYKQMSKIKVKHVASKDEWAKPKDGSNKWIEYWQKYSGYQLKDFCRDCHCKISEDNPFVGAHVKKVGSIDKNIYIVPTCDECNKKGRFDSHEFYCDESILVPANKNNI